MDDMVALIEPMIPALRRYARALLRDRAAADDLVQDCLERAIGRWHQRRADGDPRTWIFTILHNLAVTRLQPDGKPAAARSPSTTPTRASFAARRRRRTGCATARCCRRSRSCPRSNAPCCCSSPSRSFPMPSAAKVLDIPSAP